MTVWYSENYGWKTDVEARLKAFYVENIWILTVEFVMQLFDFISIETLEYTFI